MNDEIINILGAMTDFELECFKNHKSGKLERLKEKKLDLLIQIEDLERLILILNRELEEREENGIDLSNYSPDEDELTDYDEQERFNPFEEERESLTDEKMGLLLKFSTLKKELESILNKGDKKWSITEIK